VQELSLPVLLIRLKWHRRIPKEGSIEQCEGTNQITMQCHSRAPTSSGLLRLTLGTAWILVIILAIYSYARSHRTSNPASTLVSPSRQAEYAC
jgi:hypothetical protein